MKAAVDYIDECSQHGFMSSKRSYACSFPYLSGEQTLYVTIEPMASRITVILVICCSRMKKKVDGDKEKDEIESTLYRYARMIQDIEK